MQRHAKPVAAAAMTAAAAAAAAMTAIVDAAAQIAIVATTADIAVPNNAAAFATVVTGHDAGASAAKHETDACRRVGMSREKASEKERAQNKHEKTPLT